MEEMQARLRARAIQDSEFRNHLMADPFGTLEQELGSSKAATDFLRNLQAPQTGELSDDDLEGVSGGSLLSELWHFFYPEPYDGPAINTSQVAGGGGGT